MKVSIIIPVFNEERDLKSTLDKVVNLQFKEPVSSFEVIVVDDASTDSSSEVLSNVAQENQNILFKRTHEINSGKGAALKTGIESSSGDIIAFQDSDSELDPNDLPILVNEMLVNNVEFANGSRYLPGIVRPTYAYKRYVFNKLFSNLVSLLLDVRVTDIACGHKVFQRKLLNQIKIKENRFGVEAEIVIKALRLRKNAVVEVPVHYYPRNYGDGKKFKNVDGIRVLWAIFKYGLFRLK
ncbi:MAG: hypothetical protein CL840_07295 [Crocinitomicaceae bacterium]|nr:hypothetical protein [Crocinitomicaceae bacterium]|tara:strand:+ start:29914 stop:30630 length:717 start_codon:yes stop_codon:yes gene_type:complete